MVEAGKSALYDRWPEGDQSRKRNPATEHAEETAFKLPPSLAPQAEGLLAASLGYSRMYKDDLIQLDAAMGLYDAFYRWCRDAQAETHNWPSTKSKSQNLPSVFAIGRRLQQYKPDLVNVRGNVVMFSDRRAKTEQTSMRCGL
jgi:hypothetical protein